MTVYSNLKTELGEIEFNQIKIIREAQWEDEDIRPIISYKSGVIPEHFSDKQKDDLKSECIQYELIYGILWYPIKLKQATVYNRLHKWWLERHLSRPFNRSISLKLDKIILKIDLWRASGCTDEKAIVSLVNSPDQKSFNNGRINGKHKIQMAAADT